MMHSCLLGVCVCACVSNTGDKNKMIKLWSLRRHEPSYWPFSYGASKCLETLWWYDAVEQRFWHKIGTPFRVCYHQFWLAPTPLCYCRGPGVPLIHKEKYLFKEMNWHPLTRNFDLFWVQSQDTRLSNHTHLGSFIKVLSRQRRDLGRAYQRCLRCGVQS